MFFAFPFQSRLNFWNHSIKPDCSGFYNERFYLFLCAVEGWARVNVFKIGFSNDIKVLYKKVQILLLQKPLVRLALSVSNRGYLKSSKECFKSLGLFLWYMLQYPPTKTVGGSYNLLRTFSARRASLHVTAFDKFSPDFPKLDKSSSPNSPSRQFPQFSYSVDEVMSLDITGFSFWPFFSCWKRWWAVISLPLSLSPAFEYMSIITVVFALAEALWSISSHCRQNLFPTFYFSSYTF